MSRPLFFTRQNAILTAAVLTALAPASSALAQSYHLERVASGLAQPDYLTQAPGDPSNIVYYSTRITAPNGTGGGFGNNVMGGIWRYDMVTHQSTQVMSLNYRSMSGDEGLVGFTFSPDFNVPGTAGYQKIYVSSSQAGATPVDRIEEYALSAPGGTVPLDGSGHPIVNRLILQDTHVTSSNNHTIDWVGFDPRAYSMPVGSPERSYLYISNGDGAIGASAKTRPEQKASMPQGKVLRVDVDPAHPDAYPADNNKNFAIPATNPIPLWNAAHPNQQLTGTKVNFSDNTSATYTPALGEIYFTGTRNTFRMSLDRQTGDIWMGDVGENAREEINFMKADPYNGTQVPYDFGYASREGTIPTNSALQVASSSGATSLIWVTNATGSASTVVTQSLNPIREGDHNSSNPDHPGNARSAYLGGYVYRGPIPELQGKYMYTDYVNDDVYLLDFNRDTPIPSYSGTNFNLDPVTQLAALGTRTTVLTPDLSSLWQSLVIDPTNPNYTAAALGAQFAVGRVVSFAEDNQGNVYLIDFGGNRGDNSFANDYPNAGQGEIFRLTPNVGNRTWNINGSGTWSSNPNWSPFAPLTVGDSATFADALTSGSATITLDGNQFVGSLTFNNSSGSYTIAPLNAASSIYLNNGSSSASIALLGGSHTVATPMVLQGTSGAPVLNIALADAHGFLSLSGGISASNGSVNITGPGQLALGGNSVIGALSLAAGTQVALFGHNSATKAINFSISHSGTGNAATFFSTLDLATGNLVVQSSGGSDKSDRISSLNDALHSGSAGGAWTGPGITSSVAAADSAHYAVGLFDNALLGLPAIGSVSLDANSILLAAAHIGDANENGIVDIQDQSLVTNHWQSAQNNWAAGDLNLDGFVDLQDLTLVTNNWQQTSTFSLDSSGSVPNAAGGLPVSIQSTPEPSTLPLLFVSALLLGKSRRASSRRPRPVPAFAERKSSPLAPLLLHTPFEPAATNYPVTVTPSGSTADRTIEEEFFHAHCHQHLAAPRHASGLADAFALRDPGTR